MAPQPSTKAPDVALLRNLGIIAHIDAGKTTLTERILFYSQKIHRMGEVHAGTATMDFLPEEQERGITIAAACTSCYWQGHTLNLIDTPGHVDFTIEVERSLRVLDGAVGVFCAVGGVEPQSETVWRQSEQFKVPKLAFINKMDRLGANFSTTLDALRQRLGANPVPINIPLGEGEDFKGIIDLIKLERLSFDPDSQGSIITATSLEEEELALALPWREKMLEALAEADDSFMDQYLSETMTESGINQALRRGTLARTLTPTLTGSALRNIGIQPLLDAVTAFLPSPLDIPPVMGQAPDEESIIEISCQSDASLAALVFKVMMEQGRKIALIRLYSGTLNEGDAVRNVNGKTDERVSRLYRLHADRKEQIAQAVAGDIVAIMGLRSAKTGDSITSPRSPVLLESMETYQPVISIALEPRNADEGKTLDEALERFILEDPTLMVSHDEGSGHRVVSGMGELHLEVLTERMKREYTISPRAGQPHVVLRETIAQEASGQGIFDRELGTVHHHGHVEVYLSPRERGEGNRITIVDQLVEPAQSTFVPKTLLEEVKQGVEDSLLSGPQTGFPVQDVDVTITAVHRKEGATTPAGCHMAAGLAMRQAMEAASPQVLAPIMRVEISVPEDFLGPAINLFTTNGGKVDQLFERAGMKIVEGLAPMQRLFGFSTSLRSATQGRAGLTMRFERFDIA